MFFPDKDIYVRFTKEEDIKEVAAVMRPEDRRELEAIKAEPAADLLNGFKKSEVCYTLVVNGRPCSLFGISQNAATKIFTLWFLGGSGWTKPGIIRKALRLQRFFISIFLKRYGLLANCVDARYEQSLRWCRHLGAELLPAYTNDFGYKFVPVVWRCK